MEELRRLARVTGQMRLGKQFVDVGPSKDRIIKNLPDGPLVITIKDGQYQGFYLAEGRGAGTGAGPGPGARADDGRRATSRGPELELSVIPMDDDDTINIQCGDFEATCQRLNIDDMVLQHIYLCSYGFYHYGIPALSGAVDPTDDGIHSFYFGSFLFSLVWSFDPRTMKTSAILILRTVKRHMYGKLPLYVFETVLSEYKTRLSNPFLLAFVCFNMLTHVLDNNLYRTVRNLRVIETHTGHGPGKSGSKGHGHGPLDIDTDTESEEESENNNPDQEPGGEAAAEGNAKFNRPQLERQSTVLLSERGDRIDGLKKVSRKLAYVNVHLGNLQRHVKLLNVAAEVLRDEGFRKQYCAGIPGEYREACERDIEFFLSNLPALTRRVRLLPPSIEYLQDRAKSLSQVVFGLITHEDANINIKVAEASKQISEAARKDSAAMKTIALMTMLFLPGMFFSSLFAMPSLKWDNDGPGIIQKEFWVYWAVTIPATVVVVLASWIWHIWGGKIIELWDTREKQQELKRSPDSEQPAEGNTWNKGRGRRRGSVHVADLEKQA